MYLENIVAMVNKDTDSHNNNNFDNNFCSSTSSVNNTVSSCDVSSSKGKAMQCTWIH